MKNLLSDEKYSKIKAVLSLWLKNKFMSIWRTTEPATLLVYNF